VEICEYVEGSSLTVVEEGMKWTALGVENILGQGETTRENLNPAVNRTAITKYGICTARWTKKRKREHVRMTSDGTDEHVGDRELGRLRRGDVCVRGAEQSGSLANTREEEQGHESDELREIEVGGFGSGYRGARRIPVLQEAEGERTIEMQ